MQAVLFDLYGTLLVYGDMAKAWTDWIEDMASGLRLVGIKTDVKDLGKACHGFFSGSIDPIEGLTVYETRIHQLALRLGGMPNNSWCKDLATRSLVRWQSYISLDPNAIPLCSELHGKGVRIGILTNFDHSPHVHHIVDRVGFRPFLQALVVSGEVGLKKPDPRIFQLALTQLGVLARDCLFVGDHPEEDFAGASLAGMTSLLLKRDGKALDRLHVNYQEDLTPGNVHPKNADPWGVVTSIRDIRPFFP